MTSFPGIIEASIRRPSPDLKEGARAARIGREVAVRVVGQVPEHRADRAALVQELRHRSSVRRPVRAGSRALDAVT